MPSPSCSLMSPPCAKKTSFRGLPAPPPPGPVHFGRCSEKIASTSAGLVEYFPDLRSDPPLKLTTYGRKASSCSRIGADVSRLLAGCKADRTSPAPSQERIACCVRG